MTFHTNHFFLSYYCLNKTTHMFTSYTKRLLLRISVLALYFLLVVIQPFDGLIYGSIYV